MSYQEDLDYKHLRLVYSSWYGDLGGGELRMIDHLQRTRLAKSQILVLVMQQGKMRAQLARAGFYTVHTGWHRTHGPLRYRIGGIVGRRTVDRVLRRLSRAVIVCNTFSDLQTTGVIAARHGLPVVWRARADTFVPWSGLDSSTLSKTMRFVNDRVKRVVATTRYEVDSMVRQGVRPDLVTTVYNGVALDCPGADTRGQALRRTLGIDSKAVVGVTVARLIPQKGYEVLLPAVAAALSAVPEFKLLVAGDCTLDPRGDDYKRKLRRQSHQLGLEGKVHFLGFTDDVAAVLKSADLLIHPALVEPFGTALVEGMAAGLPVIAPDLPGPREILIENETALFHQPGNTEELTRQIICLANDPALRTSLGTQGRRRAETLFDVERNVSHLDAICLEALT